MPQLFRFSIRLPFCLFLSRILFLLLCISAPAQDAPQRLILKDGSYQLVTKYEIKGNRIHYYSSERDEWEDLPNSLVDWPATEKFQKDASTPSPEAIQLDKEAAQEKEVEEKPLPEVAPGLRLPEDSGVFLLDSFQGQPQIVELQQNAGDVNRNTKGNILRAAVDPVAGIKQTIELDGAHAALQSHVAVPSLYINIDLTPDEPGSSAHENTHATPQPQQPQQPEQALVPFTRFRIIRADVKNGKRIVGDLKRSATGKISQQEHFIKTTIDRVAGGWLKVTPTEPLQDGEYALVEMDEQHGMNLGVWDFGVNPKAPANANPWKPESKSAAKTSPVTPPAESH